YAPPPPPPIDDRPNHPYNNNNPHHHHFIQSVNHPPPPPISYLHPPPPPPVLPPPQSYNNPNFTFFNRSSPPRVSNRFDYPTDFRSDPNRLHYPPSSESYYKPHGTERLISSSTSIDGYASVRSGLNVVDKDYVDKYEPREPRYVSMSENDRVWKQYGDEDPKWVMKGKKNELGDGREQLRDYEYESGKFSRGREGRDEFKQVQKKSVLLRIGKPNGSSNRNRNHDQHVSKGYLVESNSSSNHRGKDKVKDRDRDRDRDRDHVGKESSLYSEKKIEGDRERSPVDLDVSFKSNALVAKAVVTPSSPMSDNNSSQTKNRKTKRVKGFDSPLSKFSERSTRSRSSSRGFDSPSSSEKAPKQPAHKNSVSNEDNSSLPGKVLAHKDSVSNEDNSSLPGKVLDQGDGNGGSKGQPLSFRLKKKRKLIKPASLSFNFQMAVKDNNIKGEDLKNVLDAPVSGAIPFPTLEELVSGKVDETPQDTVLEKDGSEVHNPNRHFINSFGDDSTENKNLTAQNTISTDVRLTLSGTDISAASADDHIEIQKWSTESNAGLDIVNVSNSLCNEPGKIQELDLGLHCINSFGDVCNENQKFTGQSVSMINDESIHTDIFAEDNATRSSSHKEHSFDKNTITEMVTPISTSVHTPSPVHRELSTDSNDDLPPTTGIVSTFANDADVFAADLNGKSGESRPDVITSIFSSKKVSGFLDSQMLTSKSTDKSISDLGIPESDDNIFVKSDSKDVALLNAPETVTKTSQREVINRVSSASQGSSVKTQGSSTNLQGSNLPLKKPSSVPAVPRVLAARSSPVFTNSKINKTVNSATKPRTWHRSSSTPAPVPLPPKQITAGQNSYIRSGNSLVRKSAPVTAIASRSSVYQLNPSGLIEARNSAGSGNKVNNTYSRVASASVVRPKTPPLSGSSKLPDCPTYSRDLSSSPLELLPASPVEGNLVEQKVTEDQIHTSSNSESQKIEDDVVTGKKIQYVKRKSNQLVAASCSDQSVQDLDKTQASSSSDSYYKRRKNQLIRTAAGDDSANADVSKASKNSIKRQSFKVWTLNSQSLGKDGVSLRQKLRPQLFPWKRSRNWSQVAAFKKERDDLHKVKAWVFSPLKWSKSIERNSKRTNEEATLAVAAAQKKKREQHGTASATAELKSRNNVSRVRIFRIGSVRYKMDPSRRTLQRISGGQVLFEQQMVSLAIGDDMYISSGCCIPEREEPPSMICYYLNLPVRTSWPNEEPSNSKQSKEEIRKSYVPKRLKIGHDEYVRIGTGNQLVRNPKRRTRVFASEKVRWSLHTARTRLAKKKKFCQFFTRFGKCNKDDGKCPYIHDSSKIAVCTKFLKGLCSNPDCKLTHKVIPERMQDCSYFLQGLCSNNNCPYRHGNQRELVNTIRTQCRKKHSYACPVFEATGACSQGTKCKLHHPKNQLKRKHQSSMDQQQKNSRGRYFGSFRAEEAMRVSDNQYLKNDDMDEDVDGDMFCQEGKFAEFISLDVGNEEAGEVTGDSRTSLMISEPLDLDAGEFDELTKPVRIMNRVVLDSPSECDMGVS
ncbi:hypothetical protein M8C21_023524, partial [Ambrosia artemisiifolia]